MELRWMMNKENLMNKVKFRHRATGKEIEFYVFDFNSQRFLSEQDLLDEIRIVKLLNFRRPYLLLANADDLNNTKCIKKYSVASGTDAQGIRITFWDKSDFDKKGNSSIWHVSWCSNCGAIVRYCEEYNKCSSPVCNEKWKENWIIFDDKNQNVCIAFTQNGQIYGDYDLCCLDKHVSNKKDALGVLIDFFVKYSKNNVKPENCEIAQYCGECWHGKDCSKCREQLREYAKEQATIPDGWDVIRQEIKKLDKIKNKEGWTVKEKGWAESKKLLLIRLCVSNGIEVG